MNRTKTVAIDLSRAFDTVDNDILLGDVNDLQLNGHIKRFLCVHIEEAVRPTLNSEAQSPNLENAPGSSQGGSFISFAF